MELGRRSSRTARASAPLPSTSQHSSASSISSGRAERATRSHHKTESPQKTNRTDSLSSEPPDSTMTPTESAVQTRRKRGRAEEREKGTKTQATHTDVTNDPDEIGEDDEAVRCLCGFDEYPGPPQLEEDNKNGIKEGIEEPEITPADGTEDLAGFFLQCDICKVWQHGGCVGIMSEDSSPDEYFCEDCRKDLHRIFVAPNGQRYSHYLPLYQSLSGTTSRAASFSKDGTRSPRGNMSGRLSSSLQSAKRRSTMNSRDAAYDEEEQLRRAIEASKGTKSAESQDGSVVQLGKRGRSDSEEKADAAKRQRTTSRTPSPRLDIARPTSQAESDDGTTARAAGSKKIRGAAARNHREKELREEKERQRLEAKQKRMGRAERRRVEDSDAPEETPPATKAPPSIPLDLVAQPSEQPAIQTATPESPPSVQPSTSHKKGGRPPNAHKKKSGKNQYTKDRDPLEGDDKSPNRSQSRDVQRGEDSGHQSASKGSSSNEGKHGKWKNTGSRVTMSDMRKRVAGILEFISRTQVEMASETISAAQQRATETLLGGLAGGLPMIKVNGELSNGSTAGSSELTSPVTEFKDLSCLEMMDILTRQLVKWQKEFA